MQPCLPPAFLTNEWGLSPTLTLPFNFTSPLKVLGLCGLLSWTGIVSACTILLICLSLPFSPYISLVLKLFSPDDFGPLRPPVLSLVSENTLKHDSNPPILTFFDFYSKSVLSVWDPFCFCGPLRTHRPIYFGIWYTRQAWAIAKHHLAPAVLFSRAAATYNQSTAVHSSGLLGWHIHHEHL